MATLTSANSALSLAVAGVFPTAQSIQGYATDDAFTAEAVEKVETQMGVDGNLSGGYVFNPYNMTVTLQADSSSIDIFGAWQLFQDSQREVTTASGSISLPSIGKKYTLNKGFLISAPPFPDVRKILQPVRIQIRWNKITWEPI